MTRWGVGPKWGVAALAYGIFAYFLTGWFPILRIPEALYPYLTILGCLLVAIGLPFYILSAKAVMRAYNAGQLVTDGVYGCCRHPLYGSWIVFIVPGIELLLHSWFGLSTSIVMYVMLWMMVKSEEDYLSEKFGETYRQYQARTPLVLPIGWLRK